MLQTTIRVIACFVCCLTVVVSVSGFSAQNDAYLRTENYDPQSLLTERLEYYRARYPEILIINLEGGVDFPADVVALDLLLGFQPVSLDYEHSTEMREDLAIIKTQIAAQCFFSQFGELKLSQV